MQLVAVYGNSRINGGEVRNSVPFLWKLTKVFDDFVIPCEATKKQNDFYRLAKIETELSILRNAENSGKPDSKAGSLKINP